MRNYSAIRERYMRDEIKVRLGGIAANLARIHSFSRNPDHKDAIERLIEESALFIEWTAVDIQDDALITLAEIQRLLVRWHRSWKEIWGDRNRREEVAKTADEWSKKIIRIAGY